MEFILGELWRRGDITLRSNFPNDWERDFYESQKRFLPEPEPASEDTLIDLGYWTQLCSRRDINHPFAERLWIDEEGRRYWVFPTSLLCRREKWASLFSLRAR